MILKKAPAHTVRSFLPSPVDESDTIKENTETHEGKTKFHTRNDQSRAVSERDTNGSIKN